MTVNNLFLGSTHDADLRQLGDAEFLKALRWTRQAPSSLVQAAKHGEAKQFAEALIAVRRPPTAKQIAARDILVSSALHDESPRTTQLADLCQNLRTQAATDGSKGSKKKKHRKTRASTNGHASRRKKSAIAGNTETELADWLNAAAADAATSPLELRLLLDLLTTTGHELSSTVRWALWRTIATAAMELSTSPDELAGQSMTDDTRIVLTAELPFVAGLVLAGVKGAAKLRRWGLKQLSQQLLDATDTDGLPNAELVPRLPLWLAAFVRAKQTAVQFGESFWDDKTETRFDAVVQFAATLCRTDGRLALSNGFALPALPILNAAATSSGLQRKSRPMRLLSALSKKKRGPKSQSKSAAAKRGRNDHPGSHSDWAKVACLRTDWSPDADLLAVTHDGDLPRIDFSVAGVNLLCGDWNLDIALNGEPISTRGDWTCTCWFSDRDVDFIELQHNAGDGVLIDRQLLLSRKLQFAVLSDCISGGGEYPLTYESRLPLATDATAKAETDSREVRVSLGKTAARCYPLVLPCDRVDSTPGGLTVSNDGLHYAQTATGGLVAPLVIDWSPDRRKLDAEWRKLTVGEQGRGLGSAEAGAYRLRVGSLHLLVYRKLKMTTESHTVLGLHTRHETVIGRFTKRGEVKGLLMVE